MTTSKESSLAAGSKDERVARTSGSLTQISREAEMMRCRFILAMERPRDTVAATAALAEAMENPVSADAATYTRPQGDKDVEGPSADYARTAGAIWGHIASGLHILDADPPWVHLRGWALDLQTGSSFEVEDRFECIVVRYKTAKIMSKLRPEEIIDETNDQVWYVPEEGTRRLEINRRGAYLVRNAILACLPQWYIESGQGVAQTTNDKVAKDSLEKNPKRTAAELVRAFQKIGVPSKDLTDYLGHSLELITPAQLARLRRIWTSISEGVADASHYFGEGADAGADPDRFAEDVKRVRKERAAKPEEPEIEADPETGEIVEDGEEVFLFTPCPCVDPEGVPDPACKLCGGAGEIAQEAAEEVDELDVERLDEEAPEPQKKPAARKKKAARKKAPKPAAKEPEEDDPALAPLTDQQVGMFLTMIEHGRATAEKVVLWVAQRADKAAGDLDGDDAAGALAFLNFGQAGHLARAIKSGELA